MRKEISLLNQPERGERRSCGNSTGADAFDRFFNRIGSLPWPLRDIVSLSIGLPLMLALTAAINAGLLLALILGLALVASPFFTAWALALIWPLPLAVASGVAVVGLLVGLGAWVWVWERRANAGERLSSRTR